MAGVFFVGSYASNRIVQAFAQELREWLTLRIGPGRIVVADAPQHDTGMVPVTADQVGEIPLMPFGKTGIISFMFGRINIVPCAPFIFGSLPLVKGFVNHEETKRVAERIQLRHMGIVTHTDRIAAHVLQLGKTSVPDSGRYGIPGDQRDGDSRLPALRTVTVCCGRHSAVLLSSRTAVPSGADSRFVTVTWQGCEVVFSSSVRISQSARELLTFGVEKKIPSGASPR